MVREKINYFDCHNFINYLDNYLAKYAQFYNSQLANFDFINLPQDNEINKLFVYTVARNLQILFPETWVGSKIENCPFLTNKARFIAKSLNSPNLIVKFRGITFQLHSSNVLIQKNDIDNETIPKKFMPSLFQEYIEKKYELRIFYLKGAFYRRGSCPHEPPYLYHLHEFSFRHSDCRSGDRQLAAGNA